jgi:hypothetical protein
MSYDHDFGSSLSERGRFGTKARKFADSDCFQTAFGWFSTF